MTALAVDAQFICVNQFGTLAITKNFKDRGLTKGDAQQHLSLIFLIGNSLSCVGALTTGAFSDKIKIYKLLIVFMFCMMTLCLLMIHEINNGIEHLGQKFDIYMILSLGLGSSLILLKAAIFWKLVSPLARGSMFCFSGVVASCGVILL